MHSNSSQIKCSLLPLITYINTYNFYFMTQCQNYIFHNFQSINSFQYFLILFYQCKTYKTYHFELVKFKLKKINFNLYLTKSNYNFQIIWKTMNSIISKCRKIIRTIIKARKILQNFQVLNYAIIAMELTFMALLILHQNIISCFKDRSIAIDFIETFTSRNSFKFVIFWCFTICVLLLVGLTIINNFCRKQNKLVMYLITIFYAIESLFAVNYFTVAIGIILQQRQFYYLPLLCITLPFMLLFLYLDQHKHIYGRMTLFMAGIYSFLGWSVWVIFIFIIGIVYYRKRNDRIMKWAYFLINSIIIWSIIHTQSQVISSIDFVSLLILVIIVTALIYFVPFELPQGSQLSYIFEIVKKIHNQTTTHILNSQQKYTLKHVIAKIEETTDIKMTHTIIQQGSEFSDSEMNRLQLLYFLENKVKQEFMDKMLLIQVKLEQGKDLFGILKLLSEVKPSGIQEIFRQQQLKLQAEEVFSSKMDFMVDLNSVQRINKYLEQFYSKIDLVVERAFSFWSYLGSLNVKQQNIDILLQKVIEQKQKAKYYLQKINQIKKCSEQNRIYGAIINSIDFYANQTASSSPAQHKKQIKIVSYQYFATKNEIISDISKPLLAELKQEQFNITGQHFYCLFPQSVLPVINQMIQTHNHNAVIIPLLSNKNIVLKKMKIYLMPTFQEGVQLLFILQKYDSGPSMLFDFTNDNILYFSNIFWKFYKIQTQFQQEQRNRLSNQIFKHDCSLHYVLQLMRNGKYINTQFNLYEVAQSKLLNSHKDKNAQKQSMKVHLQLIAQYNKKQSTILLISIKKGHFVRNQALAQDQTKAKLSSGFQIEHASSINYKEEKYFCKIINPHQPIILQKLQTLSNQSRASHLYKIGVIFFLIIALIVTTFILLVSFSDARHSNYTTLINHGKILNSQYSNIILLFYYSYVKYHLKHYPNDMTNWNPLLNISTLQSTYEGIINGLIESNINDDLQLPEQKTKLDLSFSIKFDYYDKIAHTAGFDMVSIFGGVKSSLYSYNMTFLLNNYEQIRKLQESFKIKIIYQKQLPNFQKPSQILVITVIPIAMALVLVIYYLLVQLQSVFTRVYKMMTKVTSIQINGMLQKLSYVRENIKILNKLKDKNKWSTVINEWTIISAHNKQSKEHVSIFQADTIIHILSKNWIYFGIFATLSTSLILYYTFVIYQGNQFNNIFKYLSAIFSSSNFIITQIADAFNAAVWKDTFGTINTFGTIQNLNLQTYFNKVPLPNFYQNYQSTERQNLYSNLCRLSYLNNILYFQNVTCEQMYNGSLKFGYSIVYEHYRNSLNLLRQIQLQNFLFYKRQQATQPVFIEAAYARRIIMAIITDLGDYFVKTTQQYCAYLTFNIELAAKLCGLFLFLLLAYQIKVMIILKKKCDRVLFGLRTIPKTTLLQIKNTRQMIKSTFLTDLDCL